VDEEKSSTVLQYNDMTPIYNEQTQTWETSSIKRMRMNVSINISDQLVYLTYLAPSCCAYALSNTVLLLSQSKKVKTKTKQN
jgi:hypothetical protein